jgi:LPXTG-motif cell wall-anchored protein
MKKQFLISLFLALGMGIAQGQTQSPAPLQSGTNDPARGSAQQTERGATMPPVSATIPSSETAAPESYKGCVNGSPGNWTLTSDKGKSLILSGTDDQLSQVKGQEVRINGTEASDGTFKIVSLEKLSDSCGSNNQTSSNSMGAQNTGQNNPGQSSTSTTSTTQSTTTTQPPSSTETTNQSNSQAPATATTPETSGTVSGQSSNTTSTTTPNAVTPPVTNETPANTVGTGQTGQSTAQNPAGSIAGNTQQNAAPSTNQNNNAASTGDQAVRHYSDMDQNAKLPQTASPLPLLALLGLGSLAGGLISRRKK